MFDDWQRLEYAGRAIYINPEKPDWVVANDRADELLRALQAAGTLEQAVCAVGRGRGAGGGGLAAELVAAGRLCARLDGPATPYRGRLEALAGEDGVRGAGEGGSAVPLALKECWFHLTNNCNLACRHCLFASRPGREAETLPGELLGEGLRQAGRLGCNLFYFTGGEPFTYPDFAAILGELLAADEKHVVVLTNGLLLKEQLPQLLRLPRERLHLQISLDGLEQRHDQLRGRGSFSRLVAALQLLRQHGLAATLAVAVNRENVEQLADLVDFAAAQGVANLHLLWHFVRGQGSREQFVPPAEILPRLLEAQERAQGCGVLIDNVETLRAQVFSSPGTRYDLANTAWESLAVGPDGRIYPSPALVGVAALACGSLGEGLGRVWRESPVLRKIRASSLLDSEAWRRNPLRFIVGGGDLDHSYLAGGELVGHDPYLELYNGLALWLMASQADGYPRSQGTEEKPALLLTMGDLRHDCSDGGGEVAFTHCNCVISLAAERGHGQVREFYAAAARSAREDIANPLAPEQALATFIPEEARRKSYGCGSPVHDAALRAGEVLVDLGSGSGVECFLAAKAVGAAGRVYGIDMTAEMLALANHSKAAVVRELGYDNLQFRLGFLEKIPLPDGCADVVISNCVINLSPDKRRVFHEIYRVLKPGGRLVVSDVITDGAVPLKIKNSERFRGECLGGAMRQEELLAMLAGCRFTGTRLLKRFPYRREEGVSFYSLTFAADKPEPEPEPSREVIYRGPFAAVLTEEGYLLRKGQRVALPLGAAEGRDESIFVVDGAGAVTNLALGGGCCAPFPSPSPEKILPDSAVPVTGPTNGPDLPDLVGGSCCPAPAEVKAARHRAGCLVCGGEIVYDRDQREYSCYYCGGRKQSNAACAQGHYICDDCHQRDGLSAIRVICAETREQDMLALLAQIRRHPAIPMHGPEHHALVPGVILATYRNRGGKLDKESILTGIERGSRVPGGVCGFWGNCGAAVGVGIAFSVLLAATPMTPEPRRRVQEITARVLGAVARISGARCCQREAWVALKEAAAISRELLPVPLLAAARFKCEQAAANKQCVGRRCPLA
ncbi:MAG TPA: methyltransferase domain-containing protein [Desulfurivibrio alkaliphilus]|uniref:Methyltransferase domain-containing protein n=1 Tax=Desulfurivibrio alkaliphilus TaxID=427923 RepID=A0A7C2TIH3_9BACT|nr:methyltransferase domain-containing protein [Desulfurivibrio alkaliphilus]